MTSSSGAAVVVTGPLGSGKTSVAAEVGALLEHDGVANAVVDLDWLAWLGPGISDERLLVVLHDNLRAVLTRFRVEGVTRYLLARAVQSAAELAALADAVAPAGLTVVRLDVPPDIAAERVRQRAPIDSLMTEHDLSQQTELWTASTLLEADAVVDNGARPLAEVAAEVIAHLRARDGQWAMPSGV
jgi:adenylylsulfate kinase